MRHDPLMLHKKQWKLVNLGATDQIVMHLKAGEF